MARVSDEREQAETTYDPCPQCGVGREEPCVYVYGDGTPETAPGTRRPIPHFYRPRRALTGCYTCGGYVPIPHEEAGHAVAMGPS